MKITHLNARCDRSGTQHLEVWCECFSPEDVDDLMAWLRLAKTLMREWDAILKENHESR